MARVDFRIAVGIVFYVLTHDLKHVVLSSGYYYMM
jgi:hypothetical protein